VIRASVAIVGGGVSGVFTAHYLVELGLRDIVVIEKNYLGSGSTFRCATGIRASFTSREHVELMKYSVDEWLRLSNIYGFNYLRGGYVWLLSNEEELERFKQYVSFQNKHGIPTRIIDPPTIKELVPPIREEEVYAGVHDPLAGKADPFKAVLNTAYKLMEKGVRFYTRTRALRLLVSRDKVYGIETNRGVVVADNIVLATGYGTKELLKTINIKIPLENITHHALITEAFKEAFKPLLVDWATASYIVQTFYGGFLMGTDIPEKPDTPLINRLRFLYKITRVWTRYFPWLSNVNILRYWTGYYVNTPDHHPILGPIEEYENLYIAAGFSGHGFMIAPATGTAIAHWIIDGKPYPEIAGNLKLERFKKGRLVKELAVFG